MGMTGKARNRKASPQRRNSPLFEGVWLGLWSGMALGLFFKLVQASTGSLVYTLLLNVDFLPFARLLRLERLPEWLEFALHLTVSLALGVACVLLNRRGRRPVRTGLLLGLLPAPLFVPLTLLSERTPRLDDPVALAWWLAGHLLYGVLLACWGIRYQKRGGSPQ
ncbi:hypothetical protein ABEX47_01000 [Paenibacillus ehimensis]|uniref:hypothetical protein n=1 Tax=Paenibacillus ehimensis TaxID=79264 RepID=UPI002DB7AA80|nr:hypothetical protein [Paenibacillus ehimensis]MEC0207597.1 hypothetical protein [Paenibacillus ehimensis]